MIEMIADTCYLHHMNSLFPSFTSATMPAHLEARNQVLRPLEDNSQDLQKFFADMLAFNQFLPVKAGVLNQLTTAALDFISCFAGLTQEARFEEYKKRKQCEQAFAVHPKRTLQNHFKHLLDLFQKAVRPLLSDYKLSKNAEKLKNHLLQSRGIFLKWVEERECEDTIQSYLGGQKPFGLRQYLELEAKIFRALIALVMVSLDEKIAILKDDLFDFIVGVKRNALKHFRDFPDPKKGFWERRNQRLFQLNYYRENKRREEVA